MTQETLRLARALGRLNELTLMRKLYEEHGRLLLSMETAATEEIRQAKIAVREAEATHMNPHPGLAVQS